MRNLLVILFSLFSILGHSQYFLRDAQGRIIVTESGGVLAIVSADTASHSLPQPPDTIKYSFTNVANPGDTSGLSLGIQAYYSFEETAGATAFDSAASYDGDLINTPTQNETGISNLCYSFDYASSEYIDFGTLFYDVGTNDFSASCWIWISAGGGNGGVMGKGTGSSRWYIRAPAGQYTKAVVNFGGGNIETQTNGALSNDTWYHLVYRLDRDGNATLHIDNVLQNDQDDISGSSAVDLSNSEKFAIGNIMAAPAATYYHNGLIDEVAIYNRLLSIDEISELYNTGTGRFWPFGGAGGDSIRHVNIDYDERADSVRTIVNPIGEGRSTSRTDGTLLFAYNMADSADYNDTTAYWPYLKDTAYIVETYTGLWPEDTWTGTPNHDTVFIDSSNITPPTPDPGGFWDTIFYCDYENNSAPINYELADKVADWNGLGWFDSENRWPAGWDAVSEDSIKIDALTGSKVCQWWFVDNTVIIGGYDNQGPARAGESVYMPLGGNYHEVYVSFNVQFSTNFDFGGSGKVGGGVRSSQYNHGDGCPPPYGEGWTSEVMWNWNPPGRVNNYTYYAAMSCPYGAQVPQWNTFNPTGDGLQYTVPPISGHFYFDATPAQWYNVTMRYVVNTFTGLTSNSDGLIEGYINGKLIGQVGGLHLLDYPLLSTQIDGLFHRIFNGGGRAPLVTMWAYWDDVWVFTYDVSVDVPRDNELSPPGRILSLPNWPKTE